MSDFRLRPMVPTDGPAIDALLRHEAQSTRFGFSTEYLEDVVSALLAQHPTLHGVVAEADDASGAGGLAGMATTFTDEVVVGGTLLPAAHLENLKVRHDLRRQGLGGRLAAWRIEEAERRVGRDVVIMAGVEASNAASLATAARWATHLLGPVRVVIAGPRTRLPTGSELAVRPPTEGDIEAVVEGANSFYHRHALWPTLTPEALVASSAPTVFGWPIRQYRVAVTPSGGVVAGAEVGERYRLMVDHIERVPWPVGLAGRLTGMLPADRVIRSIEVSGLWHAPDQAAAALHLWEAIRHEWHDRVTSVTTQVDPKGTLIEAIGTGSRLAPRVEIIVPLRSPVPIDQRSPVYLWR